MMNFIDIASWQSGINLRTMFNKNPELDGVIVKLTQGTGYVNPDAKAWLTWLGKKKKPFGVYHYLDIYGAEEEAAHFAAASAPWIGKAVLAIDYEEAALKKGTGYLKKCLDKVNALTGVRPLVYCSQSVIEAQDFSAIAKAGYGLWVAQYADMNPVNGFQSSPWSRGTASPFSGYALRQYTSCGLLSGWIGNLDFDLFYGDVAGWNALATGTGPTAQGTKTKKVGPEVVADVLDGKYGVRDERTRRLREAGYDPEAVQKKINELYGIAGTVKPTLAGNLDYLDCIGKILRG